MASAKQPPVRIALLRGINLARSRRLAMAELREALAAGGFEGARTHLQSGNVLVASSKAPAAVARDMRALIEAAFGMDVPVIVRTPKALAGVIDADPLGDVADDPSRYLVAFLPRKAAAAAADALAEADVAPERIEVRGSEIYVWCPGGVQNSRAMAALGRHAPAGTVRNWNTVTRLAAMAAEQGPAAA